MKDYETSAQDKKADKGMREGSKRDMAADKNATSSGSKTAWHGFSKPAPSKKK